MPTYIESPNELTLRTPVFLSDASLYVFVFPAQAEKLQTWCNVHLTPSGTTPRFRPIEMGGLSLVMASFIDIARGSSSDPDQGWTRERDLAFWIPVTESDDALSFQALAVPFLYVDLPHGIAMGREIYGLTKYPADFRYDGVHGWPDTIAATTWAPNANQEWVPGVPLMTLRRLSIESAFGSLLDLFTQDGSITVDGEDRSVRGLFDGIADPMAALRDIQKAMEDLLEQLHRPTLQVVTMKQFRDSANPRKACFQQLLRTESRITSVTWPPEAPRTYLLDFPNSATHPIRQVLGLSTLPVVEVYRLRCDFEMRAGVTI